MEEDFSKKKDKRKERRPGRTKAMMIPDASMAFFTSFYFAWKKSSSKTRSLASLFKASKLKSQSHPETCPSDINLYFSRFYFAVVVADIGINYKMFDKFF